MRNGTLRPLRSATRSADRKTNPLEISMKKHLIAVAVVSVFAAPAMAQNVQVYGVIDTGIQRFDNGTSNVTRSVDGAISTSRFGFRGSEDLGGGLKAIFNLEARLNPSAGTAGSTANNGTTLFNRAAMAGLSGGFGTIEIGQGDTTTTQDIDSKVTQAGNLGLRATVGTASVTATNGELGSDVANVVRYTTPSFNGFTAQVGYTSNNSSATTDANDSITDFYVQYEAGALGVYAGVTEKDGVGTGKTDFKAIGAKYNFGPIAVGYTYSASDASTSNDNETKTHMLSAVYPLGNGLAVHGVYAQAKLEGGNNQNGKGYTLALTKTLSKRTMLYGAYTDTNAESSATFGMTGVTAGGAGVDLSAVTVGVSHSF